MTQGRDHALFQAHPITGHVRVGGVEQTVPYHVYDGFGALFVGTGAAADVAEAFAGQDVHPVMDEAGRALLGLFVCRFDDASHGPHLELHLTALAAPSPDARLPAAPEAFLAGFGTRPDWGALSLHLWNDSPAVVAYNKEFLGLPAGLATGRVDTAGPLSFAFETPEGPLASGTLPIVSRPGLRETLSLLRLMGFGAFLGAARQTVAEAAVVAPKGPGFAANVRARTLTATDTAGIARLAPGGGALTLGGPLAAYGFQPQCAQFLQPFRFVYYPPDVA